MLLKSDVRKVISGDRRARSETERLAARDAIRRVVLDFCRTAGLAAGSRIAAYEPLPSEPGSTELLAELRRAGYQVIVPITLPDNDLDWAEWSPQTEGRSSLGIEAVARCMLVLVPAFAVDRRGARLGRGGGSYDRALARVTESVPVAALLFSGEILDSVPTDVWDRSVSAAATPEGWVSLPY